ncbi:uncharacterized protein J8A68_004419 [[Candida] subhashii]|uniref:NDT80 domain-containing protein n=1 Tax=[Candida] subhashii TaxID=561895 RepID=A0A8J5QB51_9ASCO|nr:uncharacterized protein J8A68_004419 [[Candida] subhashii]KAG7662031.1 hypothetical protein J8A68_004419 [[Candida] subhashii]
MNDTSNKDRLEDLASLFLPDILHPMQSGGNTPSNNPTNASTTNPSLKQEEYEGISSDFNLLARDSLSRNTNTPPTTAPNTSNFQDFLSNNNFINRSNNSMMAYNSMSMVQNDAMNANQQGQEQQQYSHISHYAPYIPYEANAGMASHHHMSMFNPAFQSMLPAGSQMSPSPMPQGQLQQQQQQQQQPPAYGAYQYPSALPTSLSSAYLNTLGTNWFPSNNSSNANLENLMTSGGYPQSDLQAQQSSAVDEIPSTTGNQGDLSITASPKKKKAKTRRQRDLKACEVQIDYKPTKLKRLLDFKQSGSTSINDYKLVDKDNHEISIDFNGFLNGRFLTNDTDNNNYIFTKNELQRNSGDTTPQISNQKEDPKVISCYRRNYIQISLNMNIHGFNGDSKLLKLQTSEYGYTVSRVIKYFKVEILATTNIANSKNVPILIKNDPKDVEKEKEKESKKQTQQQSSYEYKDDLVQPSSITSHEHIIILNNDTPIENGQIDKFFVVKKLQFKNATPNNGNLTFQNYYHLKIKLSCIVADLYYDDYVEDEGTIGNNASTTANNGGNNEVVLAELISEPIIVRGRNPSFYAERKDILIKGRYSTSKRSFKIAAQSAQAHLQSGEEQDTDYHNEDEDEEEDANVVDTMNVDEEDEQQFPRRISSIDENANGADEDGSPISSITDEARPGSLNQLVLSSNQQVPPLAYSTNQSALDLKSVKGYKYYPISNVYYLPPINVVYFPHRAHQAQKEDVEVPIEPVVNQNRKSSNVYFK